MDGPMGGGGRGFGGGAQQQRRENFVAGKVFLGGVDDNLTQEALQQYCSQW